MKNYLLLLPLLLSVLPAHAAWHVGKVNALMYGYDGVSVSVGIEGYNPTGCTCYTGWTTRGCLDTSRANFKNELALVMAAQAKGTKIRVNVDEASCLILAVGELSGDQ